MIRSARLSIIFVLCLSTFHLQAGAQQPAPKPKKPGGKTAPATATEVDPLAEARRTTALAMLNSLADEARNFHDQTLRARTQARTADALWETDKERARTLFRRAWEAAEAADQENERMSDDERRARRNSRGSAAVRNMPSMRREVLQFAAKRDRALGEEFLARMDETKKQETSSAATAAAEASAAQGQRFNPDEPPNAMVQRLSLARQLLDDGDVERALLFADAALEPVNTYGMNFLDVLREKNPQTADERYATLLSSAANNPVSDANSVSLLSSYVFTPNLYMTVRADGNSHTRKWSRTTVPPSNFPPQLRDAFFRTAAAILLRPFPPPEQDRTSAGRGGTYVVIARLTPLFEQYAPSFAPRLRTQLAALTPDTPENMRDPRGRLMTEGLVPDAEQMRNRTQDILNRIQSAKSSDERDELYMQAAFAARDQGDTERAREYVDKIEDLDLRKQLRAFMDFAAVNTAIREKKAEDAFRLARAGEITNVQRAWGMTEAARLSAKTGPGRAAEMLEEALVEARRIDAASPDRTRALVAIVTQLFQLDRPRAWETMNEVVKSSNAAPEYSGEDGGLVARVQLKHGAATTEFPVQTFNLTEIFTSLAKEDFNRAADLARSLTGEYPRSVATLAVARTALDKKQR
ncbi:MAG: hypothetical protein LC754_17490 [Acidobacteria bacterium]|nr:hypothetical protein [Acidobacteriota bacterium]